MLEEHLYTNLTEEEKAEVKAVVEKQPENGAENKAVIYILGIEPGERSVLRGSKDITKELLNDTQKEALERRDKKPVTEQSMNKQMAQLLRNQSIDRRMSQEMDR